MKIFQVCGDMPNPANNRRFTVFGPDFRAAAADLAEKFAMADRTAVMLTGELLEADKLIALMWRHLPGPQKVEIIRELEGMTPSSMRMHRVKERESALALANQYLIATGGASIQPIADKTAP